MTNTEEIGLSGSLSPIAYQLTGAAGSRIFKMEWKNVGFYSDIDDDGTSTDFTNFQLWLFEGSGDIEIHFGPTSVSQPDLAYDMETGPGVFLIGDYDSNADVFIGGAHVLTGNPLSPDLIVGDSLPTLSETIPEGVIYRFSTMATSVENTGGPRFDMLLSPNPAESTVLITSNAPDLAGQAILIFGSNGQALKKTAFKNGAVDISDLAPGIYLVQISTPAGKVIRKLIKN